MMDGFLLIEILFDLIRVFKISILIKECIKDAQNIFQDFLDDN